jgi:hypothetical protein
MFMYNPSDIKRPDEFSQDILPASHHLYYCFGKYEYEIAAQRLLDVSQQREEWVSLPVEDFVPPFEDTEDANYYLQKMAHESRILIKEKESFRLTGEAIEVLVENYPSESKVN